MTPYFFQCSYCFLLKIYSVYLAKYMYQLFITASYILSRHMHSFGLHNYKCWSSRTQMWKKLCHKSCVLKISRWNTEISDVFKLSLGSGEPTWPGEFWEVDWLYYTHQYQMLGKLKGICLGHIFIWFLVMGLNQNSLRELKQLNSQMLQSSIWHM